MDSSVINIDRNFIINTWISEGADKQFKLELFNILEKYNLSNSSYTQLMVSVSLNVALHTYNGNHEPFDIKNLWKIYTDHIPDNTKLIKLEDYFKDAYTEEYEKELIKLKNELDNFVNRILYN